MISYYATRDNNRYYVTPEGAIKEDEEFAFLKESLIQEYRDYEKKSTQRIEEEHEREEASDDKAPLEQDECERERLLEDSEYWDYLGEHPEAQTEEIEFYYNANGDIRRWTAIDWAPKEIEKGCWRVKPCMKSERDECPPIWLEEQLAPDPIHALIHSLLIITRHLVQYGKEHGIGHYYGTREGAEKNEATEYPLCMDWLELTLRAPYLWGIALPGPHKKVS